LREALARSDHDFVLAEPRSRAPKAHRNFIRELREKLALFADRAARFTSLFAAVVFAALFAGILINALTLQQTRHPAPFFARIVPLAAPSPAVKPQASESSALVEPTLNNTAPLPAPRPAMAPAAPTERPISHPRNSIAELAEATEPKSAAKSEPKPEPKPTRDPIGQLLKNSGSGTQNASPAEPNKTVLGAQRALVKLGFVLKPDGHMGATTKQALETFERDRGLPAHGALTTKVLRELAAQSGVTIE
jgi:hypothetical protein